MYKIIVRIFPEMHTVTKSIEEILIIAQQLRVISRAGETKPAEHVFKHSVIKQLIDGLIKNKHQ